MTLEEVLPALKTGKTITRMVLIDDPIYMHIEFRMETESLLCRTYFLENGHQIDKGDNWNSYKSLKAKDVMADNWEILE
jgi:hypothetical protein